MTPQPTQNKKILVFQFISVIVAALYILSFWSNIAWLKLIVMLSSMITIIPAAGFCVYSIVKGIKNKFQSVHDKVLLCLIAGLLIFWVIYLFVRLPQTRTTAQMMAENCKNHEEAMWNMVNYTLDALNENSDVSIHLLNDGSFDIDIPNQNDLTDSAEKMQSAGLDSIEVNESEVIQRLLKNGKAASCHPNAVIIFIAGIFLLYAKAFLNGNNPNHLPSELFGLSGQTLNGISYIGVSIVNGNFINHNA